MGTRVRLSTKSMTIASFWLREGEKSEVPGPGMEIILCNLGHKMELSDISSEFLCIGFAQFGLSLQQGLPGFSLCSVLQPICPLANVVWKDPIT